VVLDKCSRAAFVTFFWYSKAERRLFIGVKLRSGIATASLLGLAWPGKGLSFERLRNPKSLKRRAPKEKGCKLGDLRVHGIDVWFHKLFGWGLQISTQKKKSGVIAPKKFIQTLKKNNELFRSFAHQVRFVCSSYGRPFTSPGCTTRCA
jgi:hypothetical protein